MKTSEILIKAKGLIKNPDNWIKGAIARNKDGITYENALSPEACKFCSIGAIQRITGKVNFSEDALRALRMQTAKLGVDVVSYNDSPRTTHKMIMALFKKAIAKQILKEGSL